MLVFPTTTLNRQKTFKNSKGTRNAQVKTGGFIVLQIGVTLSEATLKFKGEKCWRNEQNVL